MSLLERRGHLSGRDLQGGEQSGGAVPDVIVAAPLRQPGLQRQDRIGADRSSAWIWDFVRHQAACFTGCGSEAFIAVLAQQGGEAGGSQPVPGDAGEGGSSRDNGRTGWHC
jgi:hypothetical protein